MTEREWYRAEFALSSEEHDQAELFAAEHRDCKSNSFTLKFTATGVGTKIVVKCKGCGKKKDISEYDRW